MIPTGHVWIPEELRVELDIPVRSIKTSMFNWDYCLVDRRCLKRYRRRARHAG
jgi:hypothetical protein